MSVPVNPSVRALAAGDLAIDGARILRRLDDISVFGAGAGGGITRTGLSAEDNAARRYLAESCRRDGLTARIDEAANLIVRRPGASPAKPLVLLGSHTDSVVNGGRLDGTYGVIAACEVLRVLTENRVKLPFEPVAISFTNEEGADFPCPFLGSLALVGDLDDAELGAMAGADGRSLPTALREAGGDFDAISRAAWSPGSLACYLELHIEQGPLLESGDVPIGVVEAITGRTIVDITVRGGQSHAGTTPMSLRADALPVAARAVLAVERLANDRQLCAVSTVGRIDVHPNVTNVIAGLVTMTAEIRDGQPARLLSAERALVAELAELAATGLAEIDVTVHRVTQPVATHPALREAIADAAGTLGLDHLDMFSGAGHDAQIVAALAPVGMIFVPSRNGISHAPQEHTDDVHLCDGARALLQTVLNLASDGLPRH